MSPEITSIRTSIEILRNHSDIKDKRTIAQTYSHLGNAVASSVYFKNETATILLGDDTAAIVQEDGSYLLLAAEGIVPHFLNKDPWFAGYSAVMVNISDICAMGGLPVAVTDTIFTTTSSDSETVWKGMLAASEAYGVPIVGGHTCYHLENKALSVSILGKATSHLLSSFTAKPGDAIVIAIDQAGAYYKDYAFWNASTNSNADRLQTLVRIPYQIANKQWSTSAKDISMGGIIGTMCMLLNTSKVGAEIDLKAITKPEEASWEKWLSSFPSYGYILTCEEEHIKNIQTLFSANGIVCDHIGTITEQEGLILQYNDEKIKF